MPPVFYREEGKGFPIVLIHGFCETHEIWKGFLNGLSESNRVIAIDLPGFGNSPLPASPFSIDDIAGYVIDLLKELRIDRCITIGHSLGGYVTLAMAACKPEMLKAFGLFHSTAYADTEDKKLNRNRVIEFVLKNGVPTYIESFIPSLFANPRHPAVSWLVQIASMTPEQTVVQYTKAMRDRPDRLDVLRHFRGPVLFIAGEKDGGIPWETIEKQSGLVTHPVLSVCKETGHMGMLENEDETLQAVREFSRVVSDS